MKASEKYISLRKGTLFAAFLLALNLAHPAWADDWSLKDKDGVRYTLSGMQGKWVLVNFWAPWCSFCIEEIPGFNALQQQHKDLQIIGVAVMYKNKQEVLDKIAKHAIAFPTVFGNEDTAGDFGGLDGIPASFLYAPSGKLVGHHQGPLTQREVERAIGQSPDAAALFTR